MTDSSATRPSDTLRSILDGYRPPSGVADELMRADGSIRPVWDPLIRHLASRDTAALARDFARGDQYLRDAGVYFRAHAAGGSTERDWPLSHIPVMIAEAEWATLTAGIIQRAEILEQVMADLYGSASLVRGGHLPADLIARNPEWLRPIVGIQPRSGHYLHFAAFEVGRSPDGSWLVLGDRTQAPSGSGFALENRVATSRVFHDLFPAANVHRLAGFFRAFRDALNGLRPQDRGRVAILTPGQHTDTYFEHAYIARYLAIMLLECEDLIVENGALTVRTIHGREPVDVLWRRLDSAFADPLELDEASALGTPGMVSALRSGAIDMVNCLGSGVLEARALMAFLPRIAEALTGQPLLLPNIATWWCGQDSERAYVKNNVERMLIGPAQSTQLPFDLDATTVLGGKFRRSAQEPVGDWIDREGHALVGQEAVTLSTTPAMIDGQLVPRPMILRVFAARTRDGWTVMPGGYARIGRTEDPTALSMQAGGSVADVWIVSDTPVKQESLKVSESAAFVRREAGTLPARAADNLYWLGRYIERAETSVRLLRSYHGRLEAYGPDTLPLVTYIAEHLESVTLNPDDPVPLGLQTMFDAARNCAAKVRDRFSPDGWHALSDLAKTVQDMAGTVQPGDDAIRAMTVLLRKMAGFSGLLQENMVRFDGWRFLTLGRSLERADQISGVLAHFADPDTPPGGFDVAVEVGDSVMAHSRRYAVESNRNTVIDLLVLDADNPRSVLFQLDRMRDEIARLGQNAPQTDEAARRILLLHTRLIVAAPEDISTGNLSDIRAELSAISNAIATRYLG